MSTNTTIQIELSRIQRELKAPKGQYNSFGKYAYRSAEDILEAVKPLLPEVGNLTLTDDIRCVEGRHYVRACAVFRVGGDSITVEAFAREPEQKKGMDASQITGTASSYARKYALNGLLLIDDAKDSDDPPPQQKGKVEPQQSEPITPEQVETIETMIREYGISDEVVRDGCVWASERNLENVTKLNKVEAEKLIVGLRTKIKNMGGEK